MRLAAALNDEHLPRRIPASAKDLDMGGKVVGRDTINAMIEELFEADASLAGIVVVEDDRPLGLINRNAFFARYARPYHRELFSRKSCTHFMDPGFLAVEADATVVQMGDAVAQAGDKGLNDGLIVTQDGAYHGLCSGLTVLKALSTLQGEQHRQLLSSIDYAATIQAALLADSRAALIRAFGDGHAVLWEPRDVVGGDCFFAVGDDEGVLFGLIDCTGHGVPGALLTSIAISETSRLVADHALRKRPADLLCGLNQRVKAALQQREDVAQGGADDGMDAVFVWVEADRRSARCAGARLPVFLMDAGGRIETIKGGRRGLGYRGTPADQTWPQHEIAVTDGLRLFMATDGLGDQIGERTPMAFGWKRFNAALTGAKSATIGDQAQAAWATFLDWQGSEDRRDDVTIIGAEIGAASGKGA